MRQVIRKNAITEVRVVLEEYLGRDRLDVREFLDLERSGEHRPTKKGVNIPAAELPALRAALEAAEAEALRREILQADDYERAGLPLPAELKGAAS